jgi:hypothetical protein
VEANEFILRDDSGSVRASLGMHDTPSGKLPEMVLFDEKGNTSVRVNGGISAQNLGGAIILFDSQGQRRGFLILGEDGPMLGLANSKGSTTTGLRDGNIGVFDDQGFETSIGVKDLATPSTGETHKTSAASVVLFDKNKNVIWKAP